MALNSKNILVIIVISLLATTLGCARQGNIAQATEPLPPQERVKVATTTSLYDTGLWGYLEPMFEEQYNVELDVLYAGTGIALEYGRRGDVDAITVHSKSRELDYVAEGYGVERVPFAYNYFLIVGPEWYPQLPGQRKVWYIIPVRDKMFHPVEERPQFPGGVESYLMFEDPEHPVKVLMFKASLPGQQFPMFRYLLQEKFRGEKEDIIPVDQPKGLVPSYDPGKQDIRIDH